MLVIDQLDRIVLLALHFVAYAQALPFRGIKSELSLGDPSTTVPLRLLSPRVNTGETVVGGHGVVILPGSVPVETDGQKSHTINVGGSDYQVVAGIDTAINGVPVEEYPITETENRGGLGDPEVLGLGKAATLEFAKTAEKIQAESTMWVSQEEA